MEERRMSYAESATSSTLRRNAEQKHPQNTEQKQQQQEMPEHQQPLLSSPMQQRAVTNVTRLKMEQFMKEVGEPTEQEDATKELRVLRSTEDSGQYFTVRKSLLPMLKGFETSVSQDGCLLKFLAELRRSKIPQSIPETEAIVIRSSTVGEDAGKQSGAEQGGKLCVRSCHQFSRVRPLHVCVAHSFVCFRDNGDLVAVTPRCVLIYDRPTAACELSYKEPLYSIPVSDVSRAADLDDNRILLLRQGSFQTSEERASDELLIAEVATNATRILAKISVPQTVVINSTLFNYLLLQEKSSRRDSAECRGMQVNQTEHKVYLLYDYHLAVIDMDMRLDPVVVRLRCSSEMTGSAVALMEFDHALYILTAKSWLLGTNKVDLFTRQPSSCCMPALMQLDGSLAADEIRSCVVDRLHLTAFFSMPRGRKLISLRFPVPAGQGREMEPAFAELLDCLLLQERLYSAASSTDWAAAVPSVLAWDATTEQLLVLEWGAENNGILITIDVYMEEGRFKGQQPPWSVPEVLPIRDQFPVVKTFCVSSSV